MKKLFLVCLCFISLGCFAQSKSDSLRIDLKQAIEIALNESPSVCIADRTIETKKLYKKEQIVGLFPAVAGSASYQRTLQKQKVVMDMSFMSSMFNEFLALLELPPQFEDGGPSEMQMGSYNNMGLGFNLSLPIIMPALWNSIKLTSLDIELAIEQSRASKISLINTIKKSYYAVLIAQESYKVLMDNYKNVEENAKLVTNKYNQGLVSEFEKLRADVQVQNTKPNIKAVINALELSQKALKIYMGVDIHEPLIFSGDLIDFESEMLAAKLPEINSFSLEANTDLKQLDMTIKQLERSRKIVLSGACPSLVLSGVFQYSTMGDNIPAKEFNWFPYSVVGFSLQVPITSWASTIYKTKQIKNNILSLHDNRLNLERALWLSISSNLNKIDKALADFESCTETVNMATRAHSIVQRQYEVGLATWLDLSAAELALLNSQMLYYQSIYDYLVAQAELEYVIGKN